MKYQGGKARIAKRLVETIRDHAPEATRWVEPFVGGAWMLERADSAGGFEQLHAGDALEDVILLYKAIAGGWEPPRSIPRDLYESLKKAPPSPIRALAGFGSAYGGVFFTGYCGDALNGKRTNAQIAADHVTRRRDLFARTDLRNVDYREWEAVIGRDTVVYCDPPYAGTVGYRGVAADFDHSEFWDWCVRMAEERGAHVFVSEYNGPAWAREVWARTAKQTVSAASENYTVTERLFYVAPVLKEVRP